MSFEEPSGTQRSEHIYDLKGLAILTLQPQGSDAILLLLCMSPQYESEPSGPNLAKNGDLDLQILSSTACRGTPNELHASMGLHWTTWPTSYQD